MDTKEKDKIDLKQIDEGGDKGDDTENRLKIVGEDEIIKKGRHKSAKKPSEKIESKIESAELVSDTVPVSEIEEEYKKSEQILSNMIVISTNQEINTILKKHAKKVGKQVPTMVQQIVEEWALKQKKGRQLGLTNEQRLDDIDEKLNAMEIAFRGNISQVRKRVKELKEKNKLEMENI